MEDIKKKLENIWYYNKAIIIIAVIALIVIGITIKNKVNEPKYDHSIAIISKYNYPSQEEINKLQDVFVDKVGGTFTVEIYNVALGEIGEDDVKLSKLSLDISNTISEYYFIEDLEAFENATNDLLFKTVDKVSDIDWLNNLGLDNFYYCTR